MAKDTWELKGELVLACNCTVFCPCVLSLGEHAPTEGYCQTWAGVRVDNGFLGDVDLSGLNLGIVMEIPGLMSRGNWQVGLFIDERASIYQTKALTRIFSGRAGGTTSLLTILVGKFLGIQQVKIDYEVDGDTRYFKIPKMVEGKVAPIRGAKKGENTVIKNSGYWIAPEIIVSRAEVSKMRAFGRNWNFAGRSAEICKLDWRGP
jgi:hypothetical protein